MGIRTTKDTESTKGRKECSTAVPAVEEGRKKWGGEG